ncbi:MAG: hypothetical protein IT318_24795 [Anaerolineales bacterium]|nr:hypothetical protein [Anaerolineales bacterium]
MSKAGLNWQGDELKAQLIEQLKSALGEIGLRVEGEAKKELQPGHGVLTGTLRRSLHAAAPSYDFAGDDVTPSESSPERGNQAPEAELLGDRLMIAVGSGLVYALPVHQGHGDFAGYHYLTNALDRVAPQALDIVRKHTGGKR